MTGKIGKSDAGGKLRNANKLIIENANKIGKSQMHVFETYKD
jgi:transcription-repair coupling factor (superfamily II helicase)